MLTANAIMLRAASTRANLLPHTCPLEVLLVLLVAEELNLDLNSLVQHLEQVVAAGAGPVGDRLLALGNKEITTNALVHEALQIRICLRSRDCK